MPAVAGEKAPRTVRAAEPEDQALAAILELERRWNAGARTLLMLGFPWAEVALDLRKGYGRRYNTVQWYDIPGEIRVSADRY